MAYYNFIPLPFKSLFSLFFLVVIINSASSARILEATETASPADDTLDTNTPVAATTGGAATSANTAAAATTGGAVTGVNTPASGGAATGVGAKTPVGAATTGAAVTAGGPDHPLTFFMHDILGGSNPSARAVTGIVSNPAVNGQVPFAKPNGANLPLNNGVPGSTANNALINNNNIPFLTGLGGSTSNGFQSNGNNNGGSNFPLFNGGQLPSGIDLRKLMFGTMTVIDDELTEGHELGSGTVGKAQGFYVASSEDGTSQTMAFTVMFEHGGYADSISLFGVHRSVVSESQVAVMGGTGKYLNAKGFATIKTFPAANVQVNTDGVETVLEITLYLV